MACDFARMGRAEGRVARLFNTYGPQMHPDDGRVVSNLVCQALSGSDITIYGDGSQTRSFCYISDMVEGLRSEEHTSELQSLMRISYAVFCLKKKKHKITTIHAEQNEIE